MRHLRLIARLARASARNETAYRADTLIGILHSALNLATGLAAQAILFGAVQTIRGWDHASTLALLGAYLTVGALRSLCIGPSLDSLAGMDGEIWSGRFDYTLLRPVNPQVLASFRRWRPFALLDLAAGLGVTVTACVMMGRTMTAGSVVSFLVALAAGLTIVYSILLGLSSLVLWSPGFLFTWVFDAVFQMARYPVGLYPGALRFILMWVIPVGVITTVPAQALAGRAAVGMLAGAVALAGGLLVASSVLFRVSLRRYVCASS